MSSPAAFADSRNIVADFARTEAAYLRRLAYNNAYYSLDAEGTEKAVSHMSESVHDAYERKQASERLYTAIAKLPDKQAKRLYAHYFQGLSKAEIARAEGVHEKPVRLTIQRGLRRLKKLLEEEQNCTDLSL